MQIEVSVGDAMLNLNKDRVNRRAPKHVLRALTNFRPTL